MGFVGSGLWCWVGPGLFVWVRHGWSFGGWLRVVHPWVLWVRVCGVGLDLGCLCGLGMGAVLAVGCGWCTHGFVGSGL